MKKIGRKKIMKNKNVKKKIGTQKFFEYTNNDFCWHTYIHTYTQLLLYINRQHCHHRHHHNNHHHHHHHTDCHSQTTTKTTYFSNASPSLGVLVIDLKKLDVEKYFVQTPPILADPGRCSHGSKSQSATVWNPFHQRYNLEFGKISKWNTENPVAIYLYLFQDCCLQDIKWQIKARKHPCGANINSNLSFH